MENKVKVKYQEDDYGVETFVRVKKGEEAKKPEAKKPEPETLDEDEMYETKPKIEAYGAKPEQAKP